MKLDFDIDAYVSTAGLRELIGEHEVSVESVIDPSQQHGRAAYSPKWDDLARLHFLVLERRVSCVLEFGCGYSTVVIAQALSDNRERHGDRPFQNFRRSNVFEAHAVDDMEQYIQRTRERLPENLSEFVHIHYSPARMTTFNGRVATEYEMLPNISPDLIYLDGPSRYSVQGSVNGLTTAHPSGLPMACDILKIEHFLVPGTMIVVDGRAANARFLTANFQRHWAYARVGDMHLFELQEPPLGRMNRQQIEFCIGEFWLAAPDARQT